MDTLFVNGFGESLPPSGSATDRHVPKFGHRPSQLHAGFSLIELMVVVIIISILASIAYPAYTKHTVKARRTAAEACLATYANYMERYYSTNMSYKRDSDGTVNVGTTGLDCQANSQTGRYYSYDLPATNLSVATYIIHATPKGQQSSRDSDCGTLSLNQSGTRDASGSKGVEGCW